MVDCLTSLYKFFIFQTAKLIVRFHVFFLGYLKTRSLELLSDKNMKKINVMKNQIHFKNKTYFEDWKLLSE